MLLYRCDDCGVELEITEKNFSRLIGNIPHGWKQTLTPWPGTRRIMSSVFDYCADCVLKHETTPAPEAKA